MPDEASPPNTLLPVGGVRSTRPGDVPERLKARYFVEDHGRDWRFFTDAQTRVATFEDRGRVLLSRRADPNAVRDMIAVAEHRGWRMLDARGAPAFRREAWLAGRAAGLEVRGYRPTERDLQALDRRLAARKTRESREAELAPAGAGRDGATDRLRVVEAVVRSRVGDPATQARILSGARERIADWVERGARFDAVRTPAETVRQHGPKERRRAR